MSLISRLDLIIYAIALFSVITNIFLFVYLRMTLVRLLSISSELSDLSKMSTAFMKHVTAVHDLEMFYGDETLQGLMEHAKAYTEILKTFDYFIELNDGEQIDDNTNKPEYENEEEKEE